jgi:TRAP-type C4-dicarboxylate transport system substrate-binding protein
MAMSSWLGCQLEGPAPTPRETWRFAIEETRGSVQDAYAMRFKREIEARTHGAVEVVVYPYGTLGTSDHLLEQVHNGTLQLAMSSPGHLGKLIPEVQVFTLHFVLGEDEVVDSCALSDRIVRTHLEQLYAEKRLAYLDAFSEGPMAWTTRRPIRRPQDFRGLKFRVMTSPLLIAAYRAYGASATPLPFAEVYSALQLHMIEGQVNPVFAIQEMSFHEVTDWLTFPGHASFVTTVVANPQFLAALSAERRELVHEVLGGLHREIDDVQRRFNSERLERILATKPGMHIVRLTSGERAAFREASRSVRSQFLEVGGERGTTLLRTLEAALDRCRG